MNNLMDLGGGVGWIGTLFIGGLAGWIAEKIMKTDHGLLRNIIVGILGSIVGGVLANALGIRLNEIFQGWFVGQPHRFGDRCRRIALRCPAGPALTQEGNIT